MRLSLSAMLCVLIFAACEGHPQTLDAMLDFAVSAIEANNPKALFRAIDERSRFAMDSIVSDRNRAAKIIARDYPDEAKRTALAQLGEAADVESATELFVSRCSKACMREFGLKVASRKSIEKHGNETLVHTVKGTQIRVYGGPGTTGYGLVWRNNKLTQERIKANRDLKTVIQNAKIYRQRRKLGTL